MSGDALVCHNWRVAAPGTLRGEAVGEGAAEHPVVHGAGPAHQGLSRPRCQ